MPTALLIGASRGIGFELASQYIADGWRVIATARSDEGLERLKALGAQTLRVDVANPASNSGLAWQLDGEKIDLAIYVAGAMDRKSASNPPTINANWPPLRPGHTWVCRSPIESSPAVSHWGIRAWD